MLSWMPTYFTNVLSLDLTRAAQVWLEGGRGMHERVRWRC